MNSAQKKILDKHKGHSAVAGSAEGGATPPSPVRKAGPAKPNMRLITNAFKGDVNEVIKTMRSGVNADMIPQFAERFGVSQERLFEQLRLTKSTIKARISKNEKLSPWEQDRIYRADKIWRRAVAVLEDEGAAQAWISRENRALGGEAPLALLDTEAGYELVLDTLGRIEYGVVS